MHEPSDNDWLLDSSCSNHMTENENLVANIDALVKIEVKFGTNMILDGDGKGVVNILTKQGVTPSSHIYLSFLIHSGKHVTNIYYDVIQIPMYN